PNRMGGKPSKLDRTDGAQRKKDKKKNEDKKPSSKQQGSACWKTTNRAKTCHQSPSEPEPSVESRRVTGGAAGRVAFTDAGKRMYTRTVYDFDGQEEGDLTFRRGEVIMVMQPGDDSKRQKAGWVAGDDTREGFVPGNFLADLPPDESQNCCLVTITTAGRTLRRELVRAAHPVGSYIVRPCGNNSDSLALSVKYKHLDAEAVWSAKVERSPWTRTRKPVVPFRELFIHQQKIKLHHKAGQWQLWSLRTSAWLRVIEKSDSLYTVEAGCTGAIKECRFPIRWNGSGGASNKHEFSVKSDVWSFGVCAYEIVTGGRKPYQGHQQVTEFVNSGQSGWKIP
uniref:non-specific protein-tyrosine kinase n=1 Tax=Macrostomum lignano TaxID=282301 RepID=A0A1I8FAE0_9PLAT